MMVASYIDCQFYRDLSFQLQTRISIRLLDLSSQIAYEDLRFHISQAKFSIFLSIIHLFSNVFHLI